MTITFNARGYDGFIDFIKAYAILCVLFGHTFLWLDDVGYTVWAGGQVPLFILVQVFHGFKKGTFSFNLVKVMRRVIIPFLVLELITFELGLLLGKSDATTLLTLGLTSGGYGPGSYFPWIYIQIAMLMPLMGGVIFRLGKVVSLVILLIICEGFEILFSIVDFPDWVYRLLAVRYFFLFYLGYLWVKDGISINKYTIMLIVLSLMSLIYFEYFSINDEPWFYCTTQLTHRWPCYFYRAFGVTAFLFMIYRRVSGNVIVMKFIKTLAESSYEIFLIQMSTIWLFKFTDIPLINGMAIQYGIWCMLVWIISIVCGVLLNRLINISRKPIFDNYK